MVFGLPGISISVGWPEASLERRAEAFFQHWRPEGRIRVRRSWHVEEACSGYGLMEGDRQLAKFASFEQLLLGIEQHAVHVLFSDSEAPVAIHAAGVGLPEDGGCVALVGRCFSGKSTTALWLWHHRGLRLLCDDALLLDPTPGHVIPVPRRISVRAESRALLGEACWKAILRCDGLVPTAEGFMFHAGRGEAAPGRLRLRAVFLLDRFEGSALPGEALAVPPHEAVFAVAPHTTGRLGGPAASLRAAAAIADAAPVYELSRAEPALMADAIRRVLP
jgi:hypothetical protein